MKEHAKQFVKGTAKVTGNSFKKALEVTIPPQIRNSSSVVGGLNRLGDAVVSFGSEKEEDQNKSKEYVVRHSAGAVADVAVGMALFGVPATMVTSFFSDGCKVVSTVFNGAKTDDSEYNYVGDFFSEVSAISNNFMKLFDVPSKSGAEEVHESIEALIEKLKNQGRLSDELLSDLRDLEGMCTSEIKDPQKWSKEVQEKLAKAAEDGLIKAELKPQTKEYIDNFIKEPTVQQMKFMRNGLFDDFKKSKIGIRQKSKQFADDLVDSLDGISRESFDNLLRDIIIKQYELVDKTHENLGDATYYGYRLVYSLLNTSYKGVSLFGGHYKNQLKKIIEEEDRHQSEQ
jgi:hypothetical protein